MTHRSSLALALALVVASQASAQTVVSSADLATCGTAPHIAGTASCDHSYVRGSGIPGDDWNVCALD
jgi:hypothetical protein